MMKIKKSKGPRTAFTIFYGFIIRFETNDRQTETYRWDQLGSEPII